LDYRRIESSASLRCAPKRKRPSRRSPGILSLVGFFFSGTMDLTCTSCSPRITKADNENDRKSLRRKLDAKLFLIVKEKPTAAHKEPGASAWRLPTGNRTGDETLRKVLRHFILIY